MKILVIDDARKNIASAKLTLEGHEVTICDTIQAAYDTLRNNTDFDAVLTDLFMPLGTFKGAMNTTRYPCPDGDLPAGLVFAIKASNEGIRTVICTDANHHTDWICSLLDLVAYPYGTLEETRRISYVEARNADVMGYWDDDQQEIIMVESWDEKRDKPQVKNWLEVMHGSGLFPELNVESKEERSNA